MQLLDLSFLCCTYKSNMFDFPSPPSVSAAWLAPHRPACAGRPGGSGSALQALAIPLLDAAEDARPGADGYLGLGELLGDGHVALLLQLVLVLIHVHLDLYQIYFETSPPDFRQYKSRTVLKLKTKTEKKVFTSPQPALPRCARPASVLSD